MNLTGLPPVYTLDARASERINVLRVILIILIVYIHIFGIGNVNFADAPFALSGSPLWLDAVKEAVSHVVARCAVPLFFLISSVLLYIKPFAWATNMRKKCRSLLVPYLFWNAFWILFFLFAQSVPFTRAFFATRIVREYTLLEWVACFIRIPGMDMSPFYYPFWFLFDLFVLNLLAKALKAAADRFPVLVLAAATLAWILDFELYVVSSEALLFFTLGYFIVKYRLSIERVDVLSHADLALAYTPLILLLAINPQGPRIFLKAAILVGVLFFLRLSKWIVSRPNGGILRALRFLYPYTFMIFASHEYTLTVLKKVSVRLLPQSGAVQLAEYIFLPLAAIAASVLFGMLLSKFLPRFYKLVTGNR